MEKRTIRTSDLSESLAAPSRVVDERSSSSTFTSTTVDGKDSDGADAVLWNESCECLPPLALSLSWLAMERSREGGGSSHFTLTSDGVLDKFDPVMSHIADRVHMRASVVV